MIGRIVTQVEVTKFLMFFVDTGTSMLVLPFARKKQLCELDKIGKVEMGTANQEIIEATVCGPAKVII